MCTDAVNMYTCSCAAGYNGNNCQTSKFSVNNLTDMYELYKYNGGLAEQPYFN